MNDHILISIGSYGYPSVIDLQGAVIRDTLGDRVSILVSDDWTETDWTLEAGETERHGMAKYTRLRNVCEKWGMEYMRASEAERCYHAGGDLGAYANGINRALELGKTHVAKLSQRFIVTAKNWTGICAEGMKRHGAKSCSRECYYSQGAQSVHMMRPMFVLRTECMIVDVKAWSHPGILNIIRPRPLNGHAAEAVVGQAMRAAGGSVFGCPFFGADRSRRYPDTVWKDVEPDRDAERYMALFKRYNIDPEGFDVKLSSERNGYVR